MRRYCRLTFSLVPSLGKETRLLIDLVWLFS
jgi:hypothetical protein